MKLTEATKFHRKSGGGPAAKREPSPEESVWELENRPRIGPRPVGPVAKHQPSPEGLGTNPEDDLSAVGAALNLGPRTCVIRSAMGPAVLSMSNRC
jgi:hypothetical protein